MMARPRITAEEAAKMGLVEAGAREKITAQQAAEMQLQPIAEAPPIAEPTDPETLDPKSLSGTAMRSFGKGGSLGLSDELSGAMGAVDELGRRVRTVLGATGDGSVPVEQENLPLKDALLARYRRERDEMRNETAAGERENPKTALAAELTGAVAMPAPGPGKVKGVVGLTKYGAKLGAASALGNSDADLTRGELGDAAADVAIGAGGGAAIGALTAPLQVSASRLSGLLRREAQGVRADKFGKLADAADKEIASLKGEFGSATQAGSRANENVGRAVGGLGGMSGAPSVDPATQRRALLTLSDPKFRELADSVANNTIDSVGDKLSAINRTKNAYEAALAGRDAKIQSQFADYFGRSSLREDVLPRVGRSLVNAGIGAAGGAALGVPLAAGGALLGYDPKKVFAGSVGTGMAMSAAPGSGLKTMVRNLSANPRAQNAALTTIADAGPRAVGAFSKALASQAGGEAENVRKTLKKPKNQQDEDAVAAWLNGT